MERTGYRARKAARAELSAKETTEQLLKGAEEMREACLKLRAFLVEAGDAPVLAPGFLAEIEWTITQLNTAIENFS